jgi:hypothetical protein
MSSANNLRLLSWDCADDPLDFGAFAGAAFLPLQRREAKRERGVSPEAVQARPVDELGGGAAEGEEKARAAKKGFLGVSHSFFSRIKYSIFFPLALVVDAPRIASSWHYNTNPYFITWSNIAYLRQSGSFVSLPRLNFWKP